LKLVIVESPAKAKTIERFLGNEYKVVASYGHIRDLPGSAEEIPEKYKGEKWARMAVNVEHGYEPIYIVPKESQKNITELRRLVKQADEVILATDEDREGESISWHLLEVLKPRTPVKRIAFHEITQEAIDEALAHPREMDMELVKAQETRRVLDRLFGYSLSPVLWKKVRPKLSAGRVQSVAVRLVVEREEERRRFRRAKYFSIDAHLEGGGCAFDASLVEWDGERPATSKDFDAETGNLIEPKSGAPVVHLRGEDAGELAPALKGAVPWTIVDVEQKKAKQRPQPPFMTSTLQQAASGLLGFSPRKTMQIAQRLYEGIEIGGGEREGVITYMRTDSLTLSQRALTEAEKVIKETYGAAYHTGSRGYATKSKNAQEAHEAIRPTHLSRTPQQLAGQLSGEELALYKIIWNRTIASQMPDAELLKTRVDFEAETGGKKARLRANGSVVKFPGYLKVADVKQTDTELPPVKQGDTVVAAASVSRAENVIALHDVEPVEHETQPPARYTEASLVRRLEEEGIGRPSTYAPTISTIQNRGYVEMKGKALVPTFLAVAVTKLLRAHFPEYVDLGFTARMEDALDDISNGAQDPLEFIDGFYRGDQAAHFGHGLEPQIEHELPKIEFPAIALGADPESGDEIVVRIGRNAPYLQRGAGGEGNTAPVPADLTFEEITTDTALELFRKRAQAEEPIGQHPDTGENIYALIGPYGPYVQLGERTEENKKPKRASLPKGTEPAEVDLDTAVKLLSLPRELGQHPDSGEPVLAAKGRFGPFIKCGEETRSLPADEDIYSVGLDRALALLAQPKQRRGSQKKVIADLGTHPESGESVQVCEGRYGPYVTDGSKNATLPKDVAPDKLTMDQAVDLLAKAKTKKKAKPKKKPKSKAKSKTRSKTGAKAKSKTKSSAKRKSSASSRPSNR